MAAPRLDTVPAALPAALPSDTAPAVLVLGARGRFGLAAVEAFATAGWRVLAQLRPGAEAPALAPGLRAAVSWLVGPLAGTAAQAAAHAPVQVVVNALSPAYTQAAWREQTPVLAQAGITLARHFTATLMVPGNVYPFGAQMPELLHEGAPQQPDTVMGLARAEMESRLRSAGARVVLIRAGNFFGAGKGTVFDEVVVRQLPRGHLTWPGPPDVPAAWAYLPDLARCFVEVATQRHRLPGWSALHFAGHTLSGSDWCEVLAPVARERGWLRPGAALRLKPLPWTLLRLGGVLLPRWAAMGSMRFLWQRPHRLDNRQLRTLLGGEPHTPLAQAAAAAVHALHVGPALHLIPQFLPGDPSP